MAVSNEADRNELEALRLAARANRSISQLESHRKSAVTEYAERIKRLRRVVVAIQSKEQMGVLPLEGIDSVSLSDEDLQLVHDPLRGL
jgi:hypothetical protein